MAFRELKIVERHNPDHEFFLSKAKKGPAFMVNHPRDHIREKSTLWVMVKRTRAGQGKVGAE